MFYDKGIYSGGWRYLEAAPPELEFQTAWGAYGEDINGTGMVVGTGKRNTEVIDTFLKTIGESNKAAQLAVTIQYDGYTDWFLPSKEELNLMYTNLHKKGLGGFSNGRYWASSQGNSNNAWLQSFSDDSQFNLSNYKNLSHLVRVVRAF